MDMLKGEVSWVSGTFKLFICICFSCISSNNITFAYGLKSYANVSQSWKKSQPRHFYDYTPHDKPILYTQGNGTYPPFGFGFYVRQESDILLAIYMGSYDKDSSSGVVVWCAKIRDSSGIFNAILDLTSKGDLILRDFDGSIVWSTNTSGRSVRSIHLQDDGNLVLLNGKGDRIWESFDHPTDTLLFGQTLPKGRRITSSLPDYNFPTNFYISREFDGVHAFVYLDSNVKGNRNLSPPQAYNFVDNLTWNHIFDDYSLYSYMRLEQNGHLTLYNWNGSESKVDDIFGDDDCLYPTTCGKYGVCTEGSMCGCPIANDNISLNYFEPDNPFDASSGCSLFTPISCPNTHKLHDFLELENVTYFDSPPSLTGTDIESCKNACLNQCSCKAVFFHYYVDTSFGNCTLPSEIFTLMYVTREKLALLNYKAVTFIKVQNIESKATPNRKLIKLILPVSASLIFILVTGVCFCVLMIRRKSGSAKEIECSLDIVVDTVCQFSFDSLKLATQDFQTRLGRGGFGSVYVGTLDDGTKVGVKQLNSSGQGRKEFLAEVNTIGSLHHFNLVRLVGFCDDGLNRLLVYEYMCNGSLEKWIFNQDISHLSWHIRRRIIDGVAAGLEYLHEHCKKNVIHFDIKPQNILLDEHFNTKISDFGLAKLVDRDESQVITNVRGTRGYMAPELITGHSISVKVDVYSFGILVLEILCGRKNFSTSESDCLTNLVKVKANEDRLYDLIDERAETMQQHKEEVVKIMKIAIWCLQPHFIRPTMSMVVKVLQDLLNMEDLVDLSSLTMAAPLEPNYDFSVRPTESILTGPR